MAEPELVELIANDGHEVANHGWEDERASALDPADLERSMDRTDRSLRTTERPVELYRPGGGRVSDAVTSACRGRYRCVLASVYPFDVYVPLDRWITWLVRATVHPGAVIVLHEGTARRMRVVSILDAVLRDLGARGYEVTTVSSLLARRG
jgi:peptidoglycan/xylan/chitin deacetylase (PgdA/CDA1 family)